MERNLEIRSRPNSLTNREIMNRINEPADDPLYRHPVIAEFYDLENGWDADFTYCAALAQSAASLLDLGCGTGTLAAALGRDRDVVGVDPAAAMLEVARRRRGGDAVTWIEADAQTVRLGRRFDLVLLTGHAFQVFLTRKDQEAVLATIAAHLGPDGRFVFDSRNPDFKSWELWAREDSRRTLTHPRLGPIAAHTEYDYDPKTGVLAYTNRYRVVETGEDLPATARIRYTPREELAALIEAAGLSVDVWLGDWQGTPFRPGAKEIIPLGRLA